MAFLSFISREQEGSHVSSALFPSATPGNRSHCYQSGLFRRIIMSRRLLRLPHSECSIKSAPRRNITTPSWESGSPCTVAISLRTFKSRCRKYQVCVAPRSIHLPRQPERRVPAHSRGPLVQIRLADHGGIDPRCLLGLPNKPDHLKKVRLWWVIVHVREASNECGRASVNTGRETLFHPTTPVQSIQPL